MKNRRNKKNEKKKLKTKHMKNQIYRPSAH